MKDIKKMIKIVTTLIVMVLLISMTSPIFATNKKGSGGGITPATITADHSDGGAGDLVESFGKKLVGIFQTVGVVVSVVIVLALGIKYIMGSPEEKAEYKKSMIPYLVGAILLFAASTITNIVYQFATSLNS